MRHLRGAAIFLEEPLATSLPEPRPRPRLAFRRPPHEVTTATLDRFALGTATRDERALVLRHLLTGCPECQQHLAALWAAPEAVPDEPDTDGENEYDKIFDRLVTTPAAP
jgi:hypothetical protein